MLDFGLFAIHVQVAARQKNCRNQIAARDAGTRSKRRSSSKGFGVHGETVQIFSKM